MKEQDQIIALLRAEVKAWRNAETSHYLTDYMDADDDYSHAWEVKKAMEQTDTAGALEES